jgi:hypothetical protein
MQRPLSGGQSDSPVLCPTYLVQRTYNRRTFTGPIDGHRGHNSGSSAGRHYRMNVTLGHIRYDRMHIPSCNWFYFHYWVPWASLYRIGNYWDKERGQYLNSDLWTGDWGESRLARRQSVHSDKIVLMNTNCLVDIGFNSWKNRGRGSIHPTVNLIASRGTTTRPARDSNVPSALSTYTNKSYLVARLAIR